MLIINVQNLIKKGERNKTEKNGLKISIIFHSPKMRYIELLLYLKLKQQRNGNKYLLLAAGGPVKSAASKSRESGEKAANEEWRWGRGGSS